MLAREQTALATEQTVLATERASCQHQETLLKAEENVLATSRLAERESAVALRHELHHATGSLHQVEMRLQMCESALHSRELEAPVHHAPEGGWVLFAHTVVHNDGHNPVPD